jgi:hypothetical protein
MIKIRFCTIFIIATSLGLLASVFSGCSSRPPEVNPVSISGNSAAISASFNGGESKTESRVLDMKASLPANYPGDIFPIYPGSQISQVIKSGGGYSIIAHTGADHTEVIAFYRHVMKDATVISESEESTGLTSFGTIECYNYNLNTAKSDEYAGFKTQIWITFYNENMAAQIMY